MIKKTLSILSTLIFVGCMIADNDKTEVKNAQIKTKKIEICIREWNSFKGDSVWNCSDPKPPIPPSVKKDSVNDTL